ncbi:hypothetical protein CPB83DRAFT_842548 [Crepidotus variabilis]|uniref:Uncharacterized protein n=1 Tax=Crepidotus variabilis TaxID=179855 RepID=A0A9P6ETW2_9AGAR|nr:hypothetical protein CPB83DRAFT_842548 [Crepidotus variabilis]
MASNNPTPPRKNTHRKRISALRLSSDTTSSLPEYIPSSAWSHHHYQQQQHRTGTKVGTPQSRLERSNLDVNEVYEEEEDYIPSDKPPDYPDSAEEADEDTDESDSQRHYRHYEQQEPVCLPANPETFARRPRTASPRRSKKFLPPPTHRRGKSSQSNFLQQTSTREPGGRSQRFARDDLEITPSASTSSDPYLDSLLERSVHALEMSNTLLQSSISTQASLGAILSGGGTSPQDSTLHTHAMNLSTRIQDSWIAKTAWADDLEEITRGVEGLISPLRVDDFGLEETETESLRSKSISMRKKRLHSHSREGSYSLPDTSPLTSMKRNQRKSSSDIKEGSISSATSSTTPRLTLSQQNRTNLVSPPPRPITQYIPDLQDSDSIALPSTLGFRSQSSMLFSPDWKSTFSDIASASATSVLFAAPSLPNATTSTTSLLLAPKLTDKHSEPSTPAYNMLSSFVSRPQGSSSGPNSNVNTPSTSFTTSFMSNLRRSSTSRSTSASTERSSSTITAGKRRASSPSRSPHHSQDRLSRTPHKGIVPLDLAHRPMTPPTEESSSSSDGCVAKLTVQSLKKILDDQPVPQSKASSRSSSISGIGGGLMAPKFMPRTPVRLPEAGTSTATASVSRLFTKGTHSSSTRAPSPPRLSAMKHSRNNSHAQLNNGSSAPSTPSSTSQTLIVPSNLNTSSSTPSPSPTVLSIPDMVSKVIGRVSPASSGRSTPSKRISFAELPESYASTRPGGGSSKFKEKHNKRRRKHSTSRGGRYSTDGELDISPPRWWGLGGLSMALARQEERMEDRMTRNWGGRMGSTGMGGGLDEWAV